MSRRPIVTIAPEPCDTEPMCCTGDCLQGRICPLRLAAAELAAERDALDQETADRAHFGLFWGEWKWRLFGGALVVVGFVMLMWSTFA